GACHFPCRQEEEFGPSMENAIAAGLSRQIVLTRALEATANNIANQTTAGFKAERVAFREFLANIPGGSETALADDPDVSLVIDPDSYTDFSAGGLEPTYGDLDFAIDGDGFFAVETGDGARYSRDGRFSLNVFGELVTRDGARVLDAGGAPILLDQQAGPPLLTPEGELQQNGAPIARLGVFTFDDPRSLQKIGDNLFTSEEEPSGAPFARLRQGFVETSNVVAISAVTDMIEIMRAYEQAARVIETADETARNAISTLSDTA
ncbi:MAG: flagellar hook-basal body protein, partial [Pseudomonadota bacterium]